MIFVLILVLVRENITAVYCEYLIFKHTEAVEYPKYFTNRKDLYI